MKVAVCLYGLPRGSVRTWDSIMNHVILPFNADLFIHSWDRPAMYGSLSGVKQPGLGNLVKYLKYFSNSSCNLKSFKIDKQQLYLPKIVDVEWGTVYYSNGLNNLTSIRRVSELINDFENDTDEYDIIIYTRPDIFFSRNVDISEVVNGYADWLHGGKWNEEDSRVECEDLLMITKRDNVGIWSGIIDKYVDKFYFLNNIYNILIYEVKILGLTAKQSKLFYSHGIEIVRPFNFEKFAKKIFSFLRVIFLQY
jgi:hypothetical protein